MHLLACVKMWDHKEWAAWFVRTSHACVSQCCLVPQLFISFVLLDKDAKYTLNALHFSILLMNLEN